MLKELKPCPFCKGKAHFVECAGMYFLQCAKCKAEIHDWVDTKEKAASAWNRRAPLDT